MGVGAEPGTCVRDAVRAASVLDQYVAPALLLRALGNDT